MSQAQKKIGGDDDSPAKQKLKMGDDNRAKSLVEKAKEAIARADEAQKRKGGRWEECCGIRTWVPD